MAKYFLTKVWGFSPETYPILGFNSEGARSKYLGESEPGDWLLLAGTKSFPTHPDQQGRLLGKVQLGIDQVDVESILKSINTPIPDDHYNEKGKYKWPFGLPMIKGEHFVDTPDLADIFGSYLTGMQWASYALDIVEKLGSDVLEKIEKLRIKGADIAEVPIIVKQRERHDALVYNRSKTGPGPSDSRSGSIIDNQNGSVYLFQLLLRGEPQKVFKVGYSSKVEERIESLNNGLVTNVTGYSWKFILEQKFPSSKQAYDYEQLIHSRLFQYRVKNEQEIYNIELKTIQSVWTDVFYRANWTSKKEDF